MDGSEICQIIGFNLMGKRTAVIFLFTIIVFTGTCYSQALKEFSQESEKFMAELQNLFSKVSIKEQKEQCEEMMVKFTDFWNTGFFTKEVKSNIHSLCNQMLKRRMKAYPEFYEYLSCMNGLMEYDHSVESYYAWHKSVDILINDKRSTRPFTTFLSTSYLLIFDNVMYRSKAAEWISSTRYYMFGFDSVPVVRFRDINLKCYANDDSTIIYSTSGNFYPLNLKWYGQKGKINWLRAGIEEQEVYALLENYEIYLGFSRYEADSVSFFHKKYWEKPLLGSIEDKLLANITAEKASYPRFKSYFMQVEIQSVFDSIDFVGGIEMRGRKIFGLGDKENKATLSFAKNKREFIRVLSDNFVIYPDRISSALATATIRFEDDSIYHPGLQMNYVDENKELSLIRAGEGHSKSPFYDSYHDMDIYAEAIYWQLGNPSLDIQNVKGISGLGQATFESSNYFSKPRYLQLQGIDPVNPLDLLKNFSEKYNVREIYVQPLSEEIKMPQEQVIAMLVNLSNKGFVIYDRDEKKAIIKDKLYDYINALNRKTDYDVIQFNSEIYRHQNASLELDSFGLKLYGVPNVVLSDSQNVFLFPDNQQLMIRKGMDFAFSGRVHAGNFQFYARQCEFVYDQFRLSMPVIDSLGFYVSSYETDETGQRQLVRVKNVISDLGGELYIDDPNNKSGLKPFQQYPVFTSTKDAYVYYDSPSTFNGVYNREKFYFYVYPFTIDSLDNFKTELLQFNGYLASAGIFPDIEDTLKVQPDYSLGFITKTPPEGYPVYTGKGNYFADISLNNDGLRGSGSLQYLTSTSWSDDYIFFPDSCNAFASDFVITEQLSPIEYPSVKGIDVLQHWIPYENRMIVSQTTIPFNMFNSQSRLSGRLSLTPEALRGDGKMSFEDAEMESKLYSFMQHEIFADSADFNLKSEDSTLSAFSTKNYASHIDFNERKGHFVSNGGASFVKFPLNFYICSIDEFNWFMDSYEIAIGNPEKELEMAKYNDLTIKELIDVPLEGSEFISIHPDQDSLRFISTTASYNLKEYTLYAEDVKYIRVADAAIFPSDRQIVIKPDAKMNTIADAKILANTVTRYHEIYDAIVDIKGKNDYTGIGNYDYIDEKGIKQEIFLRELGVNQSYQSVGNGYVSDSTGFTLSNDFDFSGNITLFANREFLNFDGSFRIRHECSAGERSWVNFNSDINPQDIMIKIDENLTSPGNNQLEAAIMFSEESNRFYSGFLAPKRSLNDFACLKSFGFITFDKANENYSIGQKDKLKGMSMAGNQITLGRKQCILTGEGRMNLGANFGRVVVNSYGSVKHYIIPDSTSFDAVLTVDFPFDDKALQMMVENISGKNLEGVNLTRPVFLKALTDIIGEEEAEKIVADLRLFGRFRRYPSELEHTMVFSDVKFKWNFATRSFISYGPIGIGSIGKEQINKFVDGVIEIERKRTGDVLNIYFEFEKGRYWYFFNYRNNLMQSISSNTDFNNIIMELKDDKRTEKEGKEGEEYSYIISNLRKKTDFLRKVKQ
jgi:hypothetical protein